MATFSFIVFSDTHISGRECPSDDLWLNRILISRAQEILRKAVAEINARQVDFVVHCGDLTNDGYPASIRAAADILRELVPPLFFAPGNHDTEEAESRAVMDEAFGMEGGPLYRVARVAGWRMILIDAVYWTLKDGSVADYRVTDRFVNMTAPDVELDWLRAELDGDGETPTLCFMHPFAAARHAYPITKMAGPWAVGMLEGFREGSLAATAEVKQLLTQYPCVKGIFSGHGHWHEFLVEDGVFFCQTASLAEYPNEMRLARVCDGRIEMEIIGLGEEYSQMSYMPEIGNAWVAGCETDRCVSHAV